MADVEYSVVAKLQAQGGSQFKGELSSSAQAASKLQDSLRSMGGHLYDLGAGAVGAAVKVGSVTAAMGSAAAVAAAGYIGKNLSLLEDKSIQMAAVIGAASGQSFQAAQVDSAALFDQFKRDAITSAGETKDFVNAASLLAGPIIGAGKSMEDLHRITKGVMDTAPALGASFEQAGSDVMRMMQGHAGVELPFFRALTSIKSLGIESAEVFNKWPVEKRFDAIEKALSNPAFKDAAKAAGNSFTGLKSTIEDQLKSIGGAILGPSFEYFKKGMQKWTGGVMGLLDNKGFTWALESFGQTISSRISAIFQNLFSISPNTSASGFVSALSEIADKGLGKIEQASLFLVNHWTEIKSTVMAVGHAIESAAVKAEKFVTALGGGDFTKGAERALIGGAGLKTAGAAGSSALNAAVLAKTLFGGGAEKAAGAAASVGKNIGTKEIPVFAEIAGSVGAGGASGALEGLAAAASAAWPIVVAITAAIVAAAAAFSTFEQNTFGLGDWTRTAFAGLENAVSTAIPVLEQATMQLLKFGESVAPLVGGPVLVVLNTIITLTTFLVGQLAQMAQQYGAQAEAVAILVNALKEEDNMLHLAADAFSYLTFMLKQVTSATNAFADSAVDAADKLVRKARDGSVTPGGFQSFNTMTATPEKEKGGRSGSPPPGGSGQKIEVVLKVDLGDPNEDAIFIRSRKDFERAFDEAKNRARILTSPLPGVT